MSRSEQEMVAYALEASTELLTYLPELLADLEELGSDAEAIVEVLETFHLPAQTSVVDLGCGKGTVAVEIATELGFEVTGIDLFEPFISACQALAQTAGVANLCHFEHANVATHANQQQLFDIAIFAALGDVIGPPDTSIKVIRQYVKPGGLILVSDACLTDSGHADFPGFEHYRNQAETSKQLTRWGETIERVVTDPSATPTSVVNEETPPAADEATLIERRAQALAQQYPDDAGKLLAFAASQHDATAFIEENLMDVIWVLRRALV